MDTYMYHTWSLGRIVSFAKPRATYRLQARFMCWQLFKLWHGMLGDVILTKADPDYNNFDRTYQLEKSP